MRGTEKIKVRNRDVGIAISSVKSKEPLAGTETPGETEWRSSRERSKFDALNSVSTVHYQWGSFAMTSIAIAVLINLDFHYVLGGILTLIGIAILIASVAFSVAEQRAVEKEDYGSLYGIRKINFWTIRALLALQIPFLLWAAVLMFERQG